MNKIQTEINTIYKMTDNQIVDFILHGRGALLLEEVSNLFPNTWEHRELLNFRAFALNQTLGYNHK